jgi:hypothetical protein
LLAEVDTAEVMELLEEMPELTISLEMEMMAVLDSMLEVGREVTALVEVATTGLTVVSETTTEVEGTMVEVMTDCFVVRMVV